MGVENSRPDGSWLSRFCSSVAANHQLGGFMSCGDVSLHPWGVSGPGGFPKMGVPQNGWFISWKPNKQKLMI